MAREVLKVTYEDSKYDIWFDGTHQEILSGVAIIIKKLEDDGTTLEESLAFIKGAVRAYEVAL